MNKFRIIPPEDNKVDSVVKYWLPKKPGERINLSCPLFDLYKKENVSFITIYDYKDNQNKLLRVVKGSKIDELIQEKINIPFTLEKKLTIFGRIKLWFYKSKLNIRRMLCQC